VCINGLECVCYRRKIKIITFRGLGLPVIPMSRESVPTTLTDGLSWGVSCADCLDEMSSDDANYCCDTREWLCDRCATRRTRSWRDVLHTVSRIAVPTTCMLVASIALHSVHVKDTIGGIVVFVFFLSQLSLMYSARNRMILAALHWLVIDLFFVRPYFTLEFGGVSCAVLGVSLMMGAGVDRSMEALRSMFSAQTYRRVFGTRNSAAPGV
jgi:hypothetical protein